MKLSSPLLFCVGLGFAVLTEVAYTTFSGRSSLAYAVPLSVIQFIYFFVVNVVILRKHGWKPNLKSMLLTWSVLLVAVVLMLLVRFTFEPLVLGDVISTSSMPPIAGLICGVMAVDLHRRKEQNACQ